MAVVALQPVAPVLAVLALVQAELVVQVPVVLATPVVVVALAENPVKGRPSLSRLLQAEC